MEAVVEYEYAAEQDDELTLRVGDVIKNVVTADGGWWEGELSGKKGMFPENFVRLLKEEKQKATQRKSVRELANKFKDGVPMPGAQGSVMQKKKEPVKTKKCKVMFDYAAENEDELDLTVGQTIDFIKEVEEGWWEGSLNGKTGVFPSNFVEMMEETDGEHADSSKTTTAAAGESNPNFHEIKGKKVMGVGLGDIFQHGPIKLRNTKKPEPAKPSKPDDKDNREPKLPASNPPDVTKREKHSTIERAVVRYSYVAEQPDELSLKEGDVIRIVDKHLEDEGWWKGEVHGKVGVFPDNFVELLPAQEEPKAPKKPPPPVGKNLYPKLPEKSSSIEEKNSSAKKDQARRKSALTKHRLREEEGAPDKPPPLPSTKKPVLPPTVGKKPPGLPPKSGEPPGKAEPPKAAPEAARVEMRNKEANSNHHTAPPTDTVKGEDGEEAGFDAVESSSHKLVHLTASRAKGPKKRPPSTDLDKVGSEADDAGRGTNHVQPEKPPPPVTKETRHVSPPETDRSAARDSQEGRSTQSAPPRPPEPARHHDTSAESAALARLVEDLQREVRDLRSHTVSKNEYNELRSDYLRLKQEVEAFKSSHSKKLRDLMMEVDEEKKLRLNTQVEMERVKKLVAETHV